jgi:ubiquinone biosynthesis protein COQ4
MLDQTATAPATRTRIQPRRAARALLALLRNPDDLPQVFTVIESLTGDSNYLARRLAESPDGRRLFETRPDLSARLRDRDALRALPEGSLGQAYLAFVESEGISPEGITEAARIGLQGAVRSSEHAYMRQRMRDSHDLWHTVTGYQGDLLGESALLAFTLAQTRNPGIALLVGASLFRARGPESRALVVEGFRRGRRAAWLPPQPWEDLLALPLEEARRRLGVDAPPVYTPIRTADLRRLGVIPN